MKRIAFAAVLFALAACAKGDNMADSTADTSMSMAPMAGMSTAGSTAMGASTMADTTKTP